MTSQESATLLLPLFVSERFDKLFIPEPNSGCWLWMGATDAAGNGRFEVDGKNMRPHRHSYSEIKGPIPSGMHLVRSCGMRACVNPDHMKPEVPGRGITFADQMERYCIPEPNSGCWFWMGSGDNSYGTVYLGPKIGIVRAHRASWEHHNGPIPDGLNVLHRCDIPCCINPDHLFLGDQSDNTLDMYAKGRGHHAWQKGEKHSQARLTEAQAVEILHSSEPRDVIANRFNISRVTVREIQTGRSWKHLQERSR